MTDATQSNRAALPLRPRILIVGAGVLGTVYGAKLALAGHNVTIVELSPKRRAEIHEHGLVIQPLAGGRFETARVPILEHLPSDADFDLAVAIVRKTHMPGVLASLAPTKIGTLLFMVSNAHGAAIFTDAVGSRAVVGFPGAGGTKSREVVRYAIPPKFMQQTMLSESDGARTPRIESIADLFASAGFSPNITHDLDAWLKSHEAFVASTANAIYVAGGDGKLLKRDKAVLRLNIAAIREVYATLDSLRIPVTPTWFRLWQKLPSPIIERAFGSFVGSSAWELGTDQMNSMRDEVELITDELIELGELAGVPTPALRELVARRDAMPPAPVR